MRLLVVATILCHLFRKRKMKTPELFLFLSATIASLDMFATSCLVRPLVVCKREVTFSVRQDLRFTRM